MFPSLSVEDNACLTRLLGEPSGITDWGVAWNQLVSPQKMMVMAHLHSYLLLPHVILTVALWVACMRLGLVRGAQSLSRRSQNSWGGVFLDEGVKYVLMNLSVVC